MICVGCGISAAKFDPILTKRSLNLFAVSVSQFI